ncbi:LOW QUALITY PROTEIN: hypothetical protein ACG7TL_002030 [Trametes sanguinea]
MEYLDLNPGSCFDSTPLNDKLYIDRSLQWGAKVASLWDGDLLHTVSNPDSVLFLKTFFRTFTILVSPSPSSRDSDTYTYSDDNSMDDVAEVEAALSNLDDEIAHTEDALTEWSRGSSSVGASSSYTGQYSATTSATPASYLSGEYRSIADTLLDRERRVLSTISEHTENQSRPNSFAQSGSGQGSRPTSQYNQPAEIRRSANLDGRASPVLPSMHSRAATDPSGTPAAHTPGRVVNVPGRRAGELIAFFEEKQGATGRDSPRLYGHTRTLSAPMGPRSPAPRSPSPYTTTVSQSMSTFGHTATTTGYGYGSTTGYGTSTYGYSSRPSSPTKSRAGSSVSSSGPITTMSSLLSPPPRGTTSLSTDSRLPPTSSGTFTQTRSGPSTFTGTGPTTTTSYTDTNTFTSSGFTTTATPTASSLRRPQTSPRSPLTSVRNIVAAWKERTPSLGKSIRSNTTSPSPTQGEGLFSLRRRAERGNARLRERALNGMDESGRIVERGYEGESTSGDASMSASSVLPPAFDLSELGQYANAGGTQEPLRIGLLWYLNVHAPPPYRWQRCQALLYPHMLLLSWIAPGGGRGIVTLDLLNCIEVRSVPSPLHPSAQDDVGTIAARMQSDSAEATGQLGDMGLLETLCPFQLLYSDGIERLGAESARERVRWSGTGSGSASTVYVPPLDELSDIQSLSGSSGITRRPSLASAHRMRATDDAAVSSQGYLYPGDPRVIAPSRSSSLRRTSSLTDLDEEFASAVRRAREGRPGLGFGLGLAGGISVGDGSPVTISSGPRLGGPIYMSPPPSSVGRGSDKRSRGSETSSAVSDDAFFSAGSGSGSGSATRTPTSSFYSTSSFTRALSGTDTRTGTGTGTGLVTDETIELLSGSGTNIVPSTLSYRGTTSASLLGDSHDSDTLTDGLYSSTSPSRSGLTRQGGVRRRTPRSSRSYTTTSHPSDSEGISDKENTETYSGTYTYTSDSYGSHTMSGSLSTLETYSRTTGTTPTMDTRSRSVTPTPSSSSYSRSMLDGRTTESETEGLTDGTTYYTAPAPVPKSPSTASFKSLSTIPSLSDYETAFICDTEYETAEKCPSERAESEYKTAALCPTPPPETEYVTAEVCPSDVSTDFKTADCKCKDKERVPEADEISINPPSEIPTIPSSAPSPVSRDVELPPEEIPLPPSTYSPSEPSEHTERAISPSPSQTPSSVTPTTGPSLELTPSSPRESVPTPSTFELSSEGPTTESIPGPSPIPPLSDLDLSISSPTESSVTPTPSSQLTPTVPSTIEQPTTVSSPAIPESQWGAESDQSYESSMLRASPSMASMALPEGPDTSFETSFLRPSGTPPSSEESSMLTPITEVSPSSPISVSSPSPESTPTQSTLSLLPSMASPTPLPTDLPRGVSLTRTPSSVSSVSSVSMSSSRMAPSEFELDVSTEPSLLSVPTTERTMRPMPSPKRADSVSPLMIPLPPSPAPPTPTASFQVSISTPRGDIPSIATNLETVASDAPSHILTHDVNRLLQFLNDANEARGAENREMADNIQDIKHTLEDLEDLLRQRLVPDIPPPVPHKDISVGRSSVISSDRMSRSERATPVVPREGPRVVRAISLSPPPIRLPSPDTLSESSVSFLSSHHSDDLSLMESESYPMAGPASPSWPSSSPISSPGSSPTSSPTSVPPTSATPSQLSDLGLRLPQPRSLTPTPPPLSSSPSPSSLSSGTARPVPPVSLGDLRGALDNIRQQIADMLEGQNAANRRLEELQSRAFQPPPAVPDSLGEFADRLRGIEENLSRLLGRARAAPPPASEEGGSAVGPDISDLLQEILNAARGTEQPTIHAPEPRRPGRTFDEELMDIMMSGPAPAPQPVQGPPALTPLIYRPGPRPRPRSASPTFEGNLPPRASTVPPLRPTAAPAGRREPRRPPHAPPRVQVPPIEERRAAVPPSETGSQAGAPPVVPTPAPAGPGMRPVSGPDIDFDERVRRLREQRRPGTGGWYQTETDVPPRPPTAPAAMDTAPPQGSWYQPAQPEAHPEAQPQQAVPPPGMIYPPPPPQAVPVPPGPTIVQLPSTFNDILELLRDNRSGQIAGMEQQSEIINYLRGLNQWLERDVHDRHAEIESVSARLEQTRDEVLQLLQQVADAVRRQAPQPQGGQPIVVPPTVVPPPPQQYPPGFIPTDRPRFPQESTPPLPGGPVTPGSVIPPLPDRFYPVIPPMPPGMGQPPQPPPPPQGRPYQQSDSSSEPVVPSPVSSRRSVSPSPEQRITVIPPPGGAPIPPPDFPQAEYVAPMGPAIPGPQITVMPPAPQPPTETLGHVLIDRQLLRVIVPLSIRRGRAPRLQGLITLNLIMNRHHCRQGLQISLFYRLHLNLTLHLSRIPTGANCLKWFDHPIVGRAPNVPLAIARNPNPRWVLHTKLQSVPPELPCNLVLSSYPHLIVTEVALGHVRLEIDTAIDRVLQITQEIVIIVLIAVVIGGAVMSILAVPPDDGVATIIRRRTSLIDPIREGLAAVADDAAQVALHRPTPPRMTARAGETGILVIAHAASRAILVAGPPAITFRIISRWLASHTIWTFHGSPPNFDEEDRAASPSPSHRHTPSYVGTRTHSVPRTHPATPSDYETSHVPGSPGPRHVVMPPGSHQPRDEQRRTPSQRKSQAPTVVDYGHPQGTVQYLEDARPPGAPQTAPSVIPDLRTQISEAGDTTVPVYPPHPPEPSRVDADRPPEPSTPPTLYVPTPQPHAIAPTVPPESPLPSMHPGAVSMRPLSGPGDLHHEDALAQREQQLSELGHRMTDMMEELEESEAKREENFRANEDERQKVFESHEQQRAEAAKARQDQIWDELERRLAVLPPHTGTGDALPVPPPGVSMPGEQPEEAIESEVPPGAEAEATKPTETPQSIIPTAQVDPELITDAMARAAARHADDIREIVEREREELRREQEAAQAERERAAAEAAAEHARMHEEYQAHIRALESELEAVRKELEDEKMARQAEEAERRENERAEMLERDEAMRSQLSDITNIVSEQRDELARKRELADQRWEFKQSRWEQKDEEDAQTRNMLQQILEGQAAMLAAQEASKAALLDEMRANQRAALDAIEEQRAAYEGTIRDMAEAWRADCEQRKQETIEAVKATANEQVPYNVQGYLDEFSRSLATEVRMLLSEVGKLREDKRNLEYQIGELLQFKSKYGPGGEFDPSCNLSKRQHQSRNPTYLSMLPGHGDQSTCVARGGPGGRRRQQLLPRLPNLLLLKPSRGRLGNRISQLYSPLSHRAATPLHGRRDKSVPVEGSSHYGVNAMALSAGNSVNGTMHRRKSSKDEDEDNVLVFPPSQSPPATAPLSQAFTYNGDPTNDENAGLQIPATRARVVSTPSIPMSQSYPGQPASAGPYRTTFAVPRQPPLNGATPSYGQLNGRHQAPAMRQSFSLPSPHSHAHSRTRSISGPFSPITPSPLSSSFPSSQLSMPPPHKLSSSSTAPELHQPGSSPPENGIKISQPPAHTRRHSRLHSRNLSIYFPRPGSLPSTSIAEDGAQELDFSEAPEYDEGVPIPSASPGPGQRAFREGFTFGARPPSSASSATHPMSPMKSSGSGASRRGHHHKHSLSHNFFSFLEPGAQSAPGELHTQPTPVPTSPWAPISPFPSSTSMTSDRVSTNGDAAIMAEPKTHSRSQIGKIRAPQQVSPLAIGASVWQFVLGAWLWITGQQVGSLSCTGLGYWVVFDAIGVALGHILPSRLARPDMRAEMRRPYGNVRIETVMTFAQSVYLIFTSVYVCKETVEHLLLSSGEGHHHHHGDEVSAVFGRQHRAVDLILAAVETIVTFKLAYRAAVALGVVLLQTSPARGLAGGRMEAFLRAMREIERHPQVLHLPAPHIWQLTPSLTLPEGDLSSPYAVGPVADKAQGPTQSLVVTLELHVRHDLEDVEVLRLTRWAWERCVHALHFGTRGGEGGEGEAEVTVGIVKG